MKLRVACVLLFVVFSASTSFAQSPPLDIVFEGPWMFYPDSFGGKPVLVVIAPNVPGHHPMSFSTGSGGNVPSGIYCLAFDNDAACKVNATTVLSTSTKPNPVRPSRPSP